MTLSVQTGVDLRPYNTLAVSARAAEFVELAQDADCVLLPALCRGKSVLVLGGGSNLVLAGDFSGLVILNRLRGIECLERTADIVRVRVAGGENWDDFVDHALTQGWYGLENLSAIPGTVGAAPVQNIGAYGVELKDVLETVEVLFLADGRRQVLTRDDCCFGYRDSIFKSALLDQCIITHVTFRLQCVPQLKLDYGEIRAALNAAGLDADAVTPRQVRDIIRQIRGRKLPDPARLPNVGSFFKNPVITRDQLAVLQQRWPDLVCYPVGDAAVKIAAGWLLDRLGWKGRKLGAASVHEQQALVLINRGSDAADLLNLKAAIQADVKAQAGIELEVEPRILGG